MNIYKDMYLSLFNAVTDAIESDNAEHIKNLLRAAQIKTEDMFINCEDTEYITED